MKMVSLAVRSILQRSALNYFNNIKKATFMFSATRYNYFFVKCITNSIENNSQTQMKKAHDMFRVKSSAIMVIATFVALGLSVSSGFFLRKQGDSVTQRGIDRIESWKK
ncbi:hypothetical protein HELRODRAFT_182764 [Helobdella robusta]|uniref:Uncharacterized protein n=1 Tax=Helobdella robusta TaxID=6412 RepID=T1FIP6_HELRO|nr:hypothetical protein HELRODRAFT_182764 [Helobdella robusta]ESN90163.1 hypothetical protein HELRODRAFT_182764 [Helobdella robusta]